MDSSVMANNYSNSTGLAYGIHYITLASDEVTFENNKGKFILTYITPNLDNSESYDTTLPKNSVSNVINNKANNLGVDSITTSNYVEITIPKHLFYITKIDTVTTTTTNTTTSVSHSEGSSPRASSKSTSVSKSTNVITRITYKKGQQFLALNKDKNYSTPIIIGVLE